MIYESGILTQNGVKERQTCEHQNVADSSSFVIITLMENFVIVFLISSIIFCVGFHRGNLALNSYSPTITHDKIFVYDFCIL